MLEVESARPVPRKSRTKKHERTQSAGVPVKGVSTKVIEELPDNGKRKMKKGLQESQNKLASLQPDLSQRHSSDNVERTTKKKRRKRTQSAEQLNHDAAAITKDQTAAEEDLVRANLYTNDKNKSLEKETKQSYSEALSGWQHSVESKEGHLRKTKKTESEKREKRVKKAPNTPDTDVDATIETAVSVDKVRRRLRKSTKDRTLDEGERDETDGMGSTQRTRRKRMGTEGDAVAQENLGFDDEGEGNELEKKVVKGKKKSRAKQDAEYGEEHDGDGNSEETKTGVKKTGERRRKKIKESSADLIHRALEKKRQDDGYVMCVVIHRADRLKTDLRIQHPLVRVHVIDIVQGQYVKKCSRNRAATSYYENQETVDHILPLMTEPFDFKQRKSLVPSWEDVLIVNEIYSYFLQRNEGDPNVVIFFEILDFLSMTAIHKLKNTQKSDRGWYQIAWAFLKLVGSNGSPNTDTKIRLQLYYPARSYRRKTTSNTGVPEVYHWWLSSSRVPYPSTLYVTVKGIKPPNNIDAAGRSMFAVQEEKGKMTFEELTDKIARGGISLRGSEYGEDGTTWVKLAGQPNHIPNQMMSSLQAGRRGCFVVKFSNDGRKLACGCADKDNFSIFVFETLSTRCCSKFQGHFSIIYDLCWSQDDRELLSASSDGTARSWDALSDGTPAVKVYPHPCFVYAVRYHPQRNGLVITGGYDRLVRIWSRECDGINGQLLREMDGHTGFINTICIDASGQFMFSGDSSGVIVMWNTFGNMETKSKKKRNSTTGDVQKWVISKTIKDPEMKDCIISSINLHPNGRKLLVHTRDSVTRMLDLRSFTVMNRYIGSNNFKEHVRSTLSTCGSFVFSGSEDGLVHVWDTETGNPLKVYSDLGYRAAVSDLDFHPHDNIIAFCSFGENHPVVLYHFQQSGVPDQPPYTAGSPPASPMLSTSRTFGQTTVDTMTHDSRHMQERATMAAVASETLLLNKIKKKLESVLDASSGSAALRGTNPAGSRTYSPERGTRGLHASPSDTFQRGINSLSTWGSDFSALPTTSFDETLKPVGRTRSLSPQPGQPTVSRPSSQNVGLGGLLMVKAIYAFEARSADELTFDIGDVITVIRQPDENWWVGEMADGKQGYFPTSYTISPEVTSRERTTSEKQKKHKENKQYMAVRTAEGQMKVLSAPEDSDGDVMLTKRPRADGRPPRHNRHSRDINVTRPSSSAKTKSPHRKEEEGIA